MGELESALVPAGAASAFRQPVRALIRRAPVTCPRATRIADAARLMQAQGVGSIIVVSDSGAPEGIVTDRDLRAKVVAAGVSPDEPVARIMSRPLYAADPDVPAIEALLEMLRHGIRHLPLLEGYSPGHPEDQVPRGRLLGVVSTHDFIPLREAHPLALLRDIEQQDSVDDLARLAPQTVAVVRVLLAEGVAAADLGRIMGQLNDALVRRILALTEVALGAEGFDYPPVPYCWLALGSEGRREQTLRTDQDNALIFASQSEIPTWACDRYFERLAQKATQSLIRCGFPPCPANVMATSRQWRQPLGVWRGYFSDWIRKGAPEDLLHAAIFFDFRPVWGDAGLARQLADHLHEEIAGWRAFLRHMAWAAVQNRPPVGSWGRITTPWWGPARGSVDLKLQGFLPLVNGARVHALDLALPHTHSLERLAAAAARDGRFPEAQVGELTEAYEVLMRLRLRQQVADLAAGRPAGTRVTISALNRAERSALSEALRAVNRLQDDLRSRFMTDVLFG